MGILDGQVCVVTGAGRGLGRAYAQALAAAGAKVVVNDNGCQLGGYGSSHEPADTVVREIRAVGGTAIANYEDVTGWESAGRIMQSAVHEYGRLDTLITNAAVDRRGWVLELTPADWEATLQAHVYGSLHCSLQAAKVMRNQGGGAIVNVSSGAFMAGTLRLAPYVVSKGATYSLMRALSQELAVYDIAVNALFPSGLTRATLAYVTSLHTEEGLPEAQMLKQLAARQESELMGPLVVYLASPAGRKVTGQVFGLVREQATVLGLPQTSRVAVAPGKHWDVESLAKVMPKLVNQPSR